MMIKNDDDDNDDDGDDDADGDADAAARGGKAGVQCLQCRIAANVGVQ